MTHNDTTKVTTARLLFRLHSGEGFPTLRDKRLETELRLGCHELAIL